MLQASLRNLVGTREAVRRKGGSRDSLGGRAVDVGNSGEVATDAWLPPQFADLGSSQWFWGLWAPLVECCIFKIQEFQIFVTLEGAQHMLAFWTQQEPEGADTDTERSLPQAKQKKVKDIEAGMVHFIRATVRVVAAVDPKGVVRGRQDRMMMAVTGRRD